MTNGLVVYYHHHHQPLKGYHLVKQSLASLYVRGWYLPIGTSSIVASLGHDLTYQISSHVIFSSHCFPSPHTLSYIVDLLLLDNPTLLVPHWPHNNGSMAPYLVICLEVGGNWVSDQEKSKCKGFMMWRCEKMIKWCEIESNQKCNVASFFQGQKGLPMDNKMIIYASSKSKVSYMKKKSSIFHAIRTYIHMHLEMLCMDYPLKEQNWQFSWKKSLWNCLHHTATAQLVVPHGSSLRSLVRVASDWRRKKKHLK